jgi:tRNA nucleotidyltransferase (CCA-adding enzyme)
VPNNYQKLALQVMQYHTHCHRVFDLRPGTLCDMLASIGTFKADNRLNDFLLACEADARGRLDLEDKPYPQADYIRAAQKAAQKIDRSAIGNNKIQGKEIGLAIHQLRIKEISTIKQCFLKP